MKKCEWKEVDSGDYWDTSCDQSFCFEVDGPKENGFKFCPYCGLKLKAVKP